MPAHTRPRARDARRGGGFCPRPRAPHAHRRLRAAEPVRGVSRGAVRTRQPGLRSVAGDEVPLVRAARRARPPRPRDPPRQEPSRHGGDSGAPRPDLPGRARADEDRGRALGAALAAPRGGRPVRARRSSNGARADAEGAEEPSVAARTLRRRRGALDRLRGASPAHERAGSLGPGAPGTERFPRPAAGARRPRLRRRSCGGRRARARAGPMVLLALVLGRRPARRARRSGRLVRVDGHLAAGV